MAVGAGEVVELAHDIRVLHDNVNAVQPVEARLQPGVSQCGDPDQARVVREGRDPGRSFGHR